MSPRPPRASKRQPCPWWLVGVFVLISAAGVFAWAYWSTPAFQNAAQEEPTTRALALESNAIPPERVWLVPPGEEADVPRALRASRPVVRLRQRKDGVYELLYWGNPVRAAYSYSVEAVGLKRSVLVDGAGKPQATRPLPVTEPARPDRLLPLQPAVPLEGLDCGKGDAIAVCVAVRDASTGAILCSEDYLLENTRTPAPQPAPKDRQKR